MEFGNMKVEVMLMKKLMFMFLCLVLGLAFGYAMHQPKTVTRTKTVVKRETPLISSKTRTFSKKLPAFSTILLNLDRAKAIIKTGKNYRITYQTTNHRPQKIFCEKGVLCYDDEVGDYKITQMVIEVPRKKIKWIDTIGAVTLDGISVKTANLKGEDFVIKIKNSYVFSMTTDGATIINSRVNGKNYNNKYVRVLQED